MTETLTNLVAAPFNILRNRQVKNEKHNHPTDFFWALDNVSFEIKQGDVVGIIGRNGAGKSTLLKVLSRITEPTRGDVWLHGRVGSLLEVGTGFHPELSGRENIFLNGTILGMKRREISKKFDEIVAFAEIEKFLDTPVKHYSSGMYMRLAFAVAAHLEPEILLIDEVLAVGDAQFQKKCLGKMGEVAKQGRTVLFVSHNMNAVETLCKSVLLLRSGQLHGFDSDVRNSIKQYLFGTSEEDHSNLWVNTKSMYANSWFFPHKLSICDESGQCLHGSIRNDQDVWVTIEADIKTLDPALTIGYCIVSEDGHTIYWSYQTDTPEDSWPRMHIGRNTLRSKLPHQLLNEGTYRIELIGGLHFREWLFQPGSNAPSILLTIQGGLSNSPLWTARRPGILAPVLQWEEKS